VPPPKKNKVPVLSFHRKAGTKWPILWPDHDVYGWPHTWTAPFHLIADQFRKEQTDHAWNQRLHQMYFQRILCAVATDCH
jgi:hypothetical protein